MNQIHIGTDIDPNQSTVLLRGPEVLGTTLQTNNSGDIASVVIHFGDSEGQKSIVLNQAEAMMLLLSLKGALLDTDPSGKSQPLYGKIS
jgi:hypothetical protein